MYSTQIMSEKKCIFIVPYSHIDWGWGYYLGPSISHINRANSKIIIKALKLLGKYPRYKWSGVDKVYSFMGFWVGRPDLRSELVEYIKRGNIDVACGMISTPHLLGIASTHCSGESFIRNVIYGKELLERMLGFKFKNVTLQLNDVTGLFSQLPQIVLKCGFKFLKFERPSEVYNKLNIPLDFLWESPDGSRVLCNRVPYGSWWKPNHYEDFEECKSTFLKAIEGLLKFSKINYLLFYQGGDWDPPHEELIKFVEEWNKRKLKPKLMIATPTEYFETITRECRNFPVIKGSLDNVSWAALYGVSGDKFRRLQREIVDLLLTCEKFSAIATFMGLPYQSETLKELWITELLWEDHNTVVYLYPSDLEVFLKDMDYVKNRVERLLEVALHVIASNVRHVRDDGIPIVVFNQLSWDRSDVVSVKVTFNLFNGFKHFKIVDKDGREIPYQVISKEFYLDGSIREVEILFKADVPSLGYNTYYVVPSTSEPSFDTSLKCFETKEAGTTSFAIENRYFKVRVANGHITSIIDKRVNREVLGVGRDERLRGMGCYVGNSILCERVKNGPSGLTGEVEGLHYSSSTFSPDKVEVVERGPIRAKLRVTFSYLENPTSFEITLYDGVPRIEFTTTIEAKATGRRFRAVFPLNVRGGKLFVDKPFNVESVNVDEEVYESSERSYGKMGKVFGAYSWADLSDDEYGVALISRQSAGFVLEDNKLSSILLLTIDPNSLRRFRFCPEMVGVGVHEFEYALYPHSGDVHEGRVYQRALEYLNPLITIVGVKGSGVLPPLYSFLKLRPENVILSSLFKDGREIVFRLFEIRGEPVRCHLEFFRELGEFRETDFTGRTMSKGKDSIKFNGHEVKEVRYCSSIS